MGCTGAYRNAENWSRFFSCIEDESADIDEARAEQKRSICYDLRGNIIERPIKGIYIIDGKKIVK